MKHRYNFPKIETLDDVLPHIDENFRTKEGEEGITYVNYVRMGNDTFPPISKRAPDFMTYTARVRRECRGIAFNTETRQIVSRPFQKFFNLGEREDLQIEDIDLTFPHDIMEKLDGSMIRPLPTVGGIRWGTKMGLTDVGFLAEEFVSDKPHYVELARAALGGQFTPIFEFCSRASRIVIDYPEDRMVLLAIRHNITGNYMSYPGVVDFGKRFGVEVVQKDNALKSISDLSGYVETLKNETAKEGVVVDFGGHKFKVKTDEYVRIHRGKEMLSSERHLLTLVFSDDIDDLLPGIDRGDARRITKYIERFNSEMDRLSMDCSKEYGKFRRKYTTKKDFAIGERMLAPWRRSLYFSMWDGKVVDIPSGVWQMVEKSLSNTKKFEETKNRMLWDANWEGDANVGDE